MKKTFFILMALVLMAWGMLTGCGEFSSETENQDGKSTAYAIYYINAEETELVRNPYEPKEVTRDVMLQEMMQLLKKQTAKGSNLALLPENVYITTYDIHKKTLTIDFNENYLKMKPARELLVRGGIVKMFMQVPGIVYVDFTVDGKELQDKKGEDIGLMNVDTFVEMTGKDINSYKYTTLTLYFTNKTGDKLIPEKRSVYYNSNVSLERVVLDQLLKGPREEGNQPTLPAKVSVLSATSTDGNCYLNFDESFGESALPVMENIPIYSIVNSIVDTCKVEKVQISINGETDVTFRETMRLDKFYTKDTSLVEKPSETPKEGQEETTEELTQTPTEPVPSEEGTKPADMVTAALAKPDKDAK